MNVDYSFIQFVSSELSLNLGDVHLIGHDLGAHVASYAGQRLPGIGRITGKYLSKLER